MILRLQTHQAAPHNSQDSPNSSRSASTLANPHMDSQRAMDGSVPRSPSTTRISLLGHPSTTVNSAVQLYTFLIHIHMFASDFLNEDK